MPASFTTYLEICTRIIFCNLKLGCLQHSAQLKKEQVQKRKYIIQTDPTVLILIYYKKSILAIYLFISASYNLHFFFYFYHIMCACKSATHHMKCLYFW